MSTSSSPAISTEPTIPTTTNSAAVFGADTGFLIACLVIGLVIMVVLFIWGVVSKPEIEKISTTMSKIEQKSKESKKEKKTKYRMKSMKKNRVIYDEEY